MQSPSYTCKDLILLQKYRDEKYRNGLVDLVISRIKMQVLSSAILGETVARIIQTWALTKAEFEDLKPYVEQIRSALKEIFRDAVVSVEIVHMNYIFTEYWDCVVRVCWA